jgi:uncharacterized membrane protein
VNKDAVDFVGQRSALLSLVEIGLGSIVHGLNIPFGGHFLSLYQAFFLTRSCEAARPFHLEKRAPMLISNVAAVLKSLSPAGNKLGPMLSISMQGLLYSVGLWVGGANRFGQSLGAVLLGLWAFVQPLVTYYLFFGADLYASFAYFVNKAVPFASTVVIPILIAVVAIKMLLSLFVVWLGHQRAAGTTLSQLEHRALRLGERAAVGRLSATHPGRFAALRGALRDLTRPLFLVCLAMTGLFLYYSQGNALRVWLYLLRPLAVAFIFFYFSRSRFLIRFAERLEGTSLTFWGRSFRSALEEIRRRTTLVPAEST